VIRHQGFAAIAGLVSEPLLGFLWRYLKTGAPGAGKGDAQVPTAPSLYGDVVMEHLLQRLLPAVEAVAGLKLYPTYSYCRLYRHGDVLHRHSDRPSCEISATLNLGQEPAEPWPLWIEGRTGAVEVRQQPGDALVYLGIECDHWRDPYRGASLGQVFLHYVDQNGPYAEWRYDKRGKLNLSVPLPI
jgi:hypothetical protein